MAILLPMAGRESTLEETCLSVNALPELRFQILAVSVLFNAATYGMSPPLVDVEGKRSLCPNAINAVAVSRRIAKSLGIDTADNENWLTGALSVKEKID